MRCFCRILATLALAIAAVFTVSVGGATVASADPGHYC